MSEKTCSHCKRALSLAEFNKNRAQPDGIQNQCRACSKESQARSRARFDGLNRGFWHASHRYGLTRDEYEALRARACCDACGSLEAGSGRGFFDIDHDHATGRVRGILCRRCNIALHEDITPTILRAMAEYLERHGELSAASAAENAQPPRKRQGQRQGAVMTYEKVRELRALAASGISQAKLASHYGLSAPGTSSIVRRTRWADIPDMTPDEAAAARRIWDAQNTQT